MEQTFASMFHPGRENEIRLGRVVGGAFRPGLVMLPFGRLYRHLKEGHPEKMKHIHTVDFIKGKQRLSIDRRGEETLVVKTAKGKETFQGAGGPFDVRLSSNEEAVCPVDSALRSHMTEAPDLVREKDRAVFAFDGFEIHVTVVNLMRFSTLPKGDSEIEKTSYEVEIEVKDKESIDEAVGWLHRLQQIVEPKSQATYRHL